MKRALFAVLICAAVAFCTTLVPAGTRVPVRAAGASVANDPAGDLVVFSQDYTGMSAMPVNICLASEVGSGLTENVTLGYDGTNHCVSAGATEGPLGRLLVGGLSPSLSTTLTIDMGLVRTEDHATINVFAGGAWLSIRLLDGAPSDDLSITSCYYHPTLSYATSITPDTGFNGGGRFEITIRSNSATEVNRIYLNGALILTTPFTGYRESTPITLYDSFVNPFIFCSFDSIYPGQSASLQLYSIEQTVPRYSYVTPISDPKVTSFGVDGPHPWNTVHTGLSLVGGGTIWADPTALDDYSAQDLAALKGLIANGWELGIHFSSRLSDLPQDVAFSLMDNETAAIAEIFGQAPTTWCSLQGGDNITHAEYAYTELGMLSRNGLNGSGGGLSNIGNLGDNCWGFWSPVSAAGIVIPSFSHQLDVTPALLYSISADNFSTFLVNYAASGVRFVGFREYWEKAQNSYLDTGGAGHTAISDVLSDPGLSLSFTVSNPGGKSRLLINAPWANVVRDGSGSNVTFETSGSGIVIEVANGRYTVAAAPQADFSADNSAVLVGRAIQFTDISMGGLGPLSYEWSFGDGSGSTLQSPSHSYGSPGTFTVALKVTDSAASTDTRTRVSYITVAEPLGVDTLPATAVTENSSTLNGDLAALGLEASAGVSFEWGTTAGYGSLTPAQSVSAAGAFAANLTGLSDNTTYHFRARASAGTSAAYGSDLTFTTMAEVPPPPPDNTAPTISSPLANVTSTSATVTWTTNEVATSRVEYGLTDEYGETTEQDATLTTSHNMELAGLEGGRIYHYRVISKDAAGNEAASADAVFTTAKAPRRGLPAWAWALIGLPAIVGLGTAAFLVRRRMDQD